jgi:complement component 1 Q subcomponent-binding protein
MSSRLLTSTLRKSANSIVRRNIAQNICRAAVPQLLTRGFTSTTTLQNSTKNLKDVLKSELKVSNAIANQLDSTYEEFISSQGFKVVETEGTSNVQLVKQNDKGETIRVFFDVDEVTDIPMGQPEEGAEFEEDFEAEANSLDSVFCNVRVLIEKPSDEGLLINLFLQNSENSFMVDFVTYQPNVSKFMEESVSKNQFIDPIKYQGPRFSDLDESVQTEFENYLADQGLDDELADFIIAFSEFKEENEYRNWLSNLTKFL